MENATHSSTGIGSAGKEKEGGLSSGRNTHRERKLSCEEKQVGGKKARVESCGHNLVTLGQQVGLGQGSGWG